MSPSVIDPESQLFPIDMIHVRYYFNTKLPSKIYIYTRDPFNTITILYIIKRAKIQYSLTINQIL